MNPSEVIIAIKEALNLNRPKILTIYSLVSYPMGKERLDKILKNSSNKNSAIATYEELGLFLDGLILFKRKEEAPKQVQEEEEIILSNNLILKKIRAALNLKEFELLIIFQLADFEISKSKIKDLFRSEEHPKYIECSNKTLKAFLEGLNEFYYESSDYL
ncbi:MAG TPA: DUF1456 family protein [Nitratifractor sp.]|nr:DUF1456 family protein [Nitratifractor sp.]